MVVMPNHNPNFKEYAWKPGESGNPKGRPSGSRNIRTQEVLDLIRAAGHKHPLVTLAELPNNGCCDAQTLPFGDVLECLVDLREDL